MAYVELMTGFEWMLIGNKFEASRLPVLNLAFELHCIIINLSEIRFTRSVSSSISQSRIDVLILPFSIDFLVCEIVSITVFWSWLLIIVPRSMQRRYGGGNLC
ncbi:hypothetical protein P8452_06605 [Trifolium repens]|nr:hypothetical protein P8452_06605 [Trifolium repens]